MNGTIKELGFDWLVSSHIDDSNHSVLRLVNLEIGEFVITEKAFDYLKNISETDKYKIPLLIYEQGLYGKVYLISTKEETLQWQDYKYISVNVENILSRFPSGLFEKQHRSLISLYKMYPEYGQQIKKFDYYIFFAKNAIEHGFIIESMVNKNWVKVGIKKGADGEPFFSLPFVITDDGWLEIEKAIKNVAKKQVFIAMKFKDMDSLYNTIYKAIEDAKFFPLRIDKKEHINQISSEIQYEISQSGLVVADVTEQNQGVYFEAGYAMGLNIPVIWTCNEKDKSDIHFDIRQYNTILWEDENDLRERLTKRITAIMGLQEKG